MKKLICDLEIDERIRYLSHIWKVESRPMHWTRKAVVLRNINGSKREILPIHVSYKQEVEVIDDIGK